MTWSDPEVQTVLPDAGWDSPLAWQAIQAVGLSHSGLADLRLAVRFLDAGAYLVQAATQQTGHMHL